MFEFALVCLLAFIFAELRGLIPLTPVLRVWCRSLEGGAQYYVPAVWSTNFLQSRLLLLCDKEGYIQKACSEDADEREDVITYTCYLFGDYLCSRILWAETIKKAGRLAFIRGEAPYLPGISHILSDGPFELTRPFVDAISEMMTINDGNDRRSMGYVAFRSKIQEDKEFIRVFEPLKRGLQILAEAKLRGEQASTLR